MRTADGWITFVSGVLAEEEQAGGSEPVDDWVVAAWWRGRWHRIVYTAARARARARQAARERMEKRRQANIFILTRHKDLWCRARGATSAPHQLSPASATGTSAL